jgi:hypothetical protein
MVNRRPQKADGEHYLSAVCRPWSIVLSSLTPTKSTLIIVPSFEKSGVTTGLQASYGMPQRERLTVRAEQV